MSVDYVCDIPEEHLCTYRRNPKADPLSLEGAETGYLVRMFQGYIAEGEKYISKEYFDKVVEELKLRKFTEKDFEEIRKVV